MVLDIEVLPVGPLETNAIILRCDGDCWVVDPGLWPEPIVDVLFESGHVPSALVLTHGHGDHIAGVGALKKEFPDVQLLCPAGDARMLSDPAKNLSAAFGLAVTAGPADRLIRPGDELTCGSTRWQVLDTSGHTPGGVSFYCPAAGVAIVGDALFANSIGRTDLPGADAAALLANIQANLLSLPGETRVIPGHGPETTIGRERRANPFVGDNAGP